MVTLEKIRGEMARMLEADRTLVSVEVSADSLDEALADAAVQLGISVRDIDYEVLQRGVSGFFAITKKDWKIRAYKSLTAARVQKKAAKAEAEASEESKAAVAASIDKDGNVFVFRGADGVFIRVTSPVGKGDKVAFKDAKAALSMRKIKDVDEDAVKEAVEKHDGEYVLVAPYKYVPANNPLLSVEISDDEMKAWIYVTPPGPGGADLSADAIRSSLQKSRVVAGIDENKVNEFVDTPVYGEKYLVAEGEEPRDGDNAWIEYNFETNKNKINLKESDGGKIDFKELNNIQNVVEGQPLAKKIVAQKGRHGKTVTGRYLEAKNGKDIPIPLGKNTRLADDGVTILATVSGQASLINKKINVEPILNISGDVSLKTGNISFLGTVCVSGSVEDGFSIKATGNIEIRGSVGKAQLDAEGDIVVARGVMGKGEGGIRAGRSIWARFIENATVEAGEFVIVTDGIVNCQVTAERKILCQGRRAGIIGGSLIAGEEIHAKTLGSVGGGSGTVLSVGYDPKRKARLDELLASKAAADRELEEVKLNYNTLAAQKKQKGEFSEEKEQNLKKFAERRYMLQNEIEKVDDEIAQIQDYLDELKTQGKVSASAKVYAGVRIVIRDVAEEVRADCNATTFYLDNGLVRYGKYQGPGEDVKRAPSGYISD